jgi:HK97 gp10 family phage protein
MSVHGIPQAVAALEARKVRAKLASPLAAKAGGAIVAVAQRARAPKRTGRLAAQVTVQMEEEVAHVGSTVPYDRFVQSGTRYMDAQPYAEEAARAASPAVAKAMAAVYRIALR